MVKSGSLHPAGKGINVARVLRDLGLMSQCPVS